MARWYFTPPAELHEILDGFRDKIDDWSPVMVHISRDMESFVEGPVFSTRGQGSWKPLAKSTLIRDKWPRRTGDSRKGVLMLSGWMRDQTTRDASKSNAAVINKAPHAHLQDSGTDRYASPLHQSKGKKFSRGSVSKRIRDGAGGSTHTPARPFVYIDHGRAETLYPSMILDFFFSEIE
jgi:hypothetical protein